MMGYLGHLVPFSPLSQLTMVYVLMDLYAYLYWLHWDHYSFAFKLISVWSNLKHVTTLDVCIWVLHFQVWWKEHMDE